MSRNNLNFRSSVVGAYSSLTLSPALALSVSLRKPLLQREGGGSAATVFPLVVTVLGGQSWSSAGLSASLSEVSQEDVPFLLMAQQCGAHHRECSAPAQKPFVWDSYGQQAALLCASSKHTHLHHRADAWPQDKCKVATRRGRPQPCRFPLLVRLVEAVVRCRGGHRNEP